MADWEIRRFAANALPANVDEVARAAGRFVVRSIVTFQGQEHEIEVCYPAETPELPPVVFGPPGLLQRHQNPFEGNFCLLERPLDDWKAQEWGAADLIQERLKALLSDTEEGPDVVRAAEAPMPEPFSEYYRPAYGPVVLMPGDLLSPTGASGSARLRLFDQNALRYVVIEIDGRKSSLPFEDVFAQGEVVPARWKRFDVPPPAPDGPAMAEWLRANHPDLISSGLPPKLAKSRHLKQPRSQIVGLLFTEEGPEVGEKRDAWIFLFLARDGTAHLIEHQVVSWEERQRRIPDLSRLSSKTAAVIGLGTLGGSVALELARAGIGNLELVDFDRFDVNNSVRHVLTTDFSGLPKTLGVGAACRKANPFCTVSEHPLRFGGVQWTGPSALDRAETIIHGADLVIDTTGSHQLQRLVGRLCGEAKKPFISCWLTDGFLGGHVVRIVPGDTQCFGCFARAMAGGQLAAAEAGENTSVTAQGCSHPTTTGAGFDATELAANTARIATQTLLGKPAGDHTSINFYRFHSEDFPRFISERLRPNDGCEQCMENVGSTKTPSVIS